MQATPSNVSSDPTIRDLLARVQEVLIKRFWWFAVVFVAVLAATWLVTRYQTRVYEATGTVVIERAPPRVLSGVREVVNLGTGGYWGSRQYYEAQRRIIRSREVAQMVVDRHGLAYDEHLFGLDKPGLELSDEAKRDIMGRQDPAAILAGRVVVVLDEGSMIASVSIRDSDPQYAKQLVSWVMSAYRDRNVYVRRRTTREAYKDLKVIVSEMESRKNASENALLELETKYDLSENHSRAVSQRILALNQQLTEAKRRRMEARQLVRKLSRYAKRKDVFDVVDSNVLADGLTRLIKQQLLQLNVSKRELEAVYLDKHPKMKTLGQQMRFLKGTARKHLRGLLKAARGDLKAANETVRNVEASLKEAYGEDAGLRKARLRYEQLESKRDVDRNLYALVAKRLAETDLTNQVDVNNVNVLDEPLLPTTPIKPKKRLNYALGLVLAMVLGLGMAGVAEVLDNTVKDRENIERQLGLPYLGGVPRYEFETDEDGDLPIENVDLYAHYRPKSRVAEAARSIRTNLLFMRPGQSLRSMVVTSAHPREGKTSTSTTIAIAMAGSSGRCVLVDTDLRKPRLHKVFGLSADSGVTSLILNPDLELAEVVQKTEVPGLHLLASGPLPPDSSRILHNERFRELVERLKAEYEVVVFDSPPAEVVSDALVLSRMTDGVVLVAHALTTRMPALVATTRSLRSVNAQVLGVVVSRTSASGAGYGYYYGRRYRRGRAYGYRYAADGGDEEEPPLA